MDCDEELSQLQQLFFDVLLVVVLLYQWGDDFFVKSLVQPLNR